MSGPVIRLQSLSPEDLLILLSNIRHVMAGGDASKYLIPDEALQAFMAHCSQRIGEAYFRTPRNTIKSFVHLLSILDQNPGTDWRSYSGRRGRPGHRRQLDIASANGDGDELFNLNSDSAGRTIDSTRRSSNGSGGRVGASCARFRSRRRTPSSAATVMC